MQNKSFAKKKNGKKKKDKEIRDELKRRRKNGEDVVIYRGEITAKERFEQRNKGFQN